MYFPRMPIAARRKKLSRAIRVFKFMFFFLTAVCMKVNGGVFAQNINLSLKDVPLAKVFKEIQRQTSYKFIYSDEVLDSKKQVSVSLNNVPLREALDKTVTSRDLEYIIDGNTIVVRRKRGEPVKLADAILVDVSGRVTNEKGEPVVGASILVKGSTLGTSTDEQGNFKLQLTKDQQVLVISSIGFETKEVRVPESGSINISLVRKDDTAIEDVVVVGFGTQKK